MNENLKTVRNYSLIRGMTAANIYRMIKAGEIDTVVIDGVIFVRLKESELQIANNGYDKV